MSYFASCANSPVTGRTWGVKVLVSTPWRSGSTECISDMWQGSVTEGITVRPRRVDLPSAISFCTSGCPQAVMPSGRIPSTRIKTALFIKILLS